ncbi:(-)-isopiperitenol/(-)-carveol dehydrogenase, mitochondrial-like [Heracleum sosnowskyi]|uniref:(-)-isopiperitenol/(-)-carveol dehydrogenase, mitochondrial-like n=1 Tax=Heracleum sosnowskyi TaxID=360622 RepID=A0AAD8M3T3_9APIA|nr:(-)-isopiperitenol/(-)-carveol dehydrogenase, mitochondrial-like [Heracleum sosnowskyi]
MATGLASASLKRLEGKVAIITGGASGIGEATACLFAEQGARVVIADIQDELGENVAKTIGYQRCKYIHCDVCDENQVKSLVDFTVRTFGQLDIMFSNAGIVSNSDQDVLSLDMSQLDRVFAVNVRGMAACVKHAARSMVDNCVKGKIVCTASVAGKTGGKKRTDYFMSKHAVVALVKSASKQLGEFGIRVNCVSPYAIATPLMTKLYNKVAEEVEKIYQPLTSLKDEALKAKDIANAVLFLVSADSTFVTGHDLVVDGGFSI